MMFSSNQVLEVSGDLSNKDDVKEALEFALKKEGILQRFSRSDKPTKCTFQIGNNGEYCIGWALYECDNIPDGWKEFQFDFDIDIIASIISKHLLKQEAVKPDWFSGSEYKGFIMKAIDANETCISRPFYGIVKFIPYICLYAK